MERFFKNLFKTKLRKTKYVYNEFLRDISVLSLSQEDSKVCDEEIIKQEVVLTMKSFSNNKSPGNDGLTKQFCEIFWEKLTQPFKKSSNQTKGSKKLVTSQRQAVIKLIEKKDKGNCLISNWRRISLLNFKKTITKYFQILSHLSKPLVLRKRVLTNQED